MQPPSNFNTDDSFDKLFTDAAWANMNALLDQEMPVEKPRRRGFLVFWNTHYAAAASVVLLLGVGAWYWNSSFNHVSQSVASIENANNQLIINHKNNAGIVAHLKKVDITPKYSQSKTSTSAVAAPLRENKNDTINEIATSIHTVTPPIFKENNIENLPSLPLVSLESAPIFDKIEPIFATTPIEIQKNNARKRNFKIGMNAIFNTSSAFIGGEIGATTAFKMNEKHDLSVGLSAARRNYNVAFSMRDSAHFMATSAVNSLQLPIVLSRRMNKNWSVGVGITATYNMMESTKMMDATALSAANNLNKSSIFAKTTENIPKSDLIIYDESTKSIPQNTADIASFSTSQIQRNLRKFNILSGLYAKYALKKTNITASIDYNLLGYNVTSNQGHNILVKVGLERVF
jgi:hypothetical protein